MTNDPVHPNHYNQEGISCMDAIEAALTPDEVIGFLKGQIFKYNWRAGKKDAIEQDYKKLGWYHARLLEFVIKQGKVKLSSELDNLSN